MRVWRDTLQTSCQRAAPSGLLLTRPSGTPRLFRRGKSWDNWDNESTVNCGGSRRPTTAELTSRCQQVIYEHLPDKRTGV